jgi:hypothetical protein
MKIRKIFQRVGDSMSKYNYLAEIDLETDVTKYGYYFSGEKMEDRYKTDVFSLETLEYATNFDMFISDIHECNKKWWKESFNSDLKNAAFNIKFTYRFLRFKIKELIKWIKKKEFVR